MCWQKSIIFPEYIAGTGGTGGGGGDDDDDDNISVHSCKISIELWEKFSW
jgi:hypothetical protein